MPLVIFRNFFIHKSGIMDCSLLDFALDRQWKSIGANFRVLEILKIQTSLETFNASRSA